MGETTDQTRREIERTRENMTRTINQLEAEVRHTLDWKARVRTRPWMYVGIALATGFVLAGGPWRATSHSFRAIRRARQTPLQRLQETAAHRLDEFGNAIRDGSGKALRNLPIGVTVDGASSNGKVQRADVMIGPPPPMWERLALRAGEAGATAAASILTNRLLEEMKG